MEPSQFVTAIYRFVVLLFSLSVHESAHAWTASRLGDQTSRMQGRISLNPMVHIDPIGTLLFPAIAIFGPLFGLGIGSFMVGWAKPVMVNTRNFRKITRDDNLVSIAGPVSNLLLALLATLFLAGIVAYGHSLPLGVHAPQGMITLAHICEIAMQINLALFFFNLLPIPPLDGSHVLRNALPYNTLHAFDRIGMLSYVLIIVIGAPFVSFMMGPALNVLYAVLAHV